MSFIEERLAKFEAAKAQYDEQIAAKPHEAIKVTLPDGKEIEATSFETTPLDIANGISAGFARSRIVARLNGETLWDLSRPIEASCSLELLAFDDAKEVFWHSAAHILGHALEVKYNGMLGHGPALKDGEGFDNFFYDIFIPSGESVNESGIRELQQMCNKSVKAKDVFERVEVSKETALDIFSYSKFKTYLINEHVQDGETCTLYRSGSFVDFCGGPHVPNTGFIKAMNVSRSSGAYWLGDATNESLQRLYGMAFPDKKQLTAVKKAMAEAELRNHRRIGREQELFYISDLSPGCPMFLPAGHRVYRRLLEFIRAQYHKRDYSEVQTPRIYDHNLWVTSGHWQHYRENMFSFEVNEAGSGKKTAKIRASEGEEKEKKDSMLFGMNSMNCPGHCVMFKSKKHSYKELPLRIADFGILHRNELSGAMSGLTRVRCFRQDDGHIFCRDDQIGSEIEGVIDMIKEVYDTLHFDFELNLSTRPETFLGEIEVWNRAEERLKEVLDHSGHNYNILEGDGAFYGPKIDICVTDSMGRKHQCATIQLDFQLPMRFDLTYTQPKKGEDGKVVMEEVRPIIIHRAVLGSLERFMGVLLEHLGGKWPMWLNPHQVMVIPMAERHMEFSRKLVQDLRTIYGFEFFVDMNERTEETLAKRMRDAGSNKKASYVLVIGDKEMETGEFGVRRNFASGDIPKVETMTLDQLKEEMVRLQSKREFAIPE